MFQDNFTEERYYNLDPNLDLVIQYKFSNLYADFKQYMIDHNYKLDGNTDKWLSSTLKNEFSIIQKNE